MSLGRCGCLGPVALVCSTDPRLELCVSGARRDRPPPGHRPRRGDQTAPPPGPDYLMDNIILPTSGRGVRAANSCTPFHSGHLGQHRLPRQGKFCW